MIRFQNYNSIIEGFIARKSLIVNAILRYKILKEKIIPNMLRVEFCSNVDYAKFKK